MNGKGLLMRWPRQARQTGQTPHAPTSGKGIGQARRDAEVYAAQTAASNAAFFALLADYEEVVLRMAVAMVGLDAAEDAAQEAITHAWEAWPTLRDPASAGAWLLRITANHCRNWRNRAGARQRLTQPFDTLSDERGLRASVSEHGNRATLAQLGAHPGDSDHALALDLRRAVNSLDEELRLIVVLRFYVGMDSIAIGEALGAPDTTIRTRLRRALGILRMRLGVSDEHLLPPKEQSQHSADEHAAYDERLRRGPNQRPERRM